MSMPAGFPASYFVRHVVWLGFFAWLGLGMAMAQAPAGQVMVATGTAKAIDNQGRERTLGRGDEIRSGDRIVTGDDSLVQVRMADGGYLSVRAGTEMAVDKFVHDEKDPGNSSFLISLVKGGFRSITGLIGRSNPSAYRIATSTATIGIRGTDHEPMVIPPGPPNIPVIDLPGVYDKVNEGETFIQNARGTISLKPGQVGFAPLKPDVAPQILPRMPDFYKAETRVDARREKQGQDEKADGKRTGGLNQLRPGVSARTGVAPDALRERVADSPIRLAPALVPTLADPAVQPSLSSTTVLQPISSAPRIEPISGSPTLQPMLTSPTVQQVLTAPAIQPMLTSPTVQPILTAPAIHPVLTSPTPILQSPFQIRR